MKNEFNYPKNPLQVISLFILLCYTVASTFFGFGNFNFSCGERWTIVLFIVLFPIIVFAVFCWLIIQYHDKLYAPFEFRSDEGFYGVIETSSKEQITQKEKEEEQELLDEEKKLDSQNREKIPNKSLKDKHEEVAPTILDMQSLHIKQKTPHSYNEARSWIVSTINKKLGIELIENITIRMGYGQRLYFDAFFRGEKFIYVLEVKLMREPIESSLLRGRLNGFLLSVDKLKKKNDNVKPILAIVGIQWKEDSLRNYKEQLKQVFPSDFEIEVFDFETLKEQYKS